MEASLSNITPYRIDANKTDFYNPVLKKLSDKRFKETFLNNDDLHKNAEQLSSQSRFNASYRIELVKTLKQQYKNSLIDLKEDSLVHQNIEKLLLTDTLTVTTGQQIHIFLGPFFVVNKILSCCAEATAYTESLSSKNVVPIFWMATEDHDFEEIKSTRLYNETYTWDIDSTGPVGRLNPNTLLPIVEQARERIDQTEENKKFLDVCHFAYQNCNSFADATRYIIHQYFESTGIVVLDPDDAFLKSTCVDLIESDIFKNQPAVHIDNSIAELKSFSIKAPINTRPINMFFISDKQRNRIELNAEGTYQLINTDKQLSGEEIKQLLKTSPEVFSPNALLRPLYQQAILPNLHYVCGASEIMYWFELKSAMTNANLMFPKLSIRKSLFFLSKKKYTKT